MDKIEEVLTRGVEKIYPNKEELEEVLRGGKKIKLYNGIDPTGPQLHLGHMVVLRKLRQFQNLGHHVILLIGDFTGMIGDPSGKTKARQPLSREQVLENAKAYQEQASKILNFKGENPVEIRYNSKWLDKLSLAEIIQLASQVTYAQVIERDMFQKRMKEGQELFVNELFYPLMQGYDSVAMDVDLEVGGSDQIFNMLMGRTLMKKFKRKEKFVLATKLLAEPGKEKMGKTAGNLVALTEAPNEMFGQVMAWPDEMVSVGFELLTDILVEELPKNAHPMELKKKLAWEIIAQLYSKEEADEAQKEFKRVVQKKETPAEGLIKVVLRNNATLKSILVDSGVAPSASEVTRVINAGGVDINDQVITDPQFCEIKRGDLIKFGKRKYIEVK